MIRSKHTLRALVIQHEEPTPSGLVGEWLDLLGAEVDVYRIDIETRTVDPKNYDLIISLGSEFAAYDDSIPWIGSEISLFRNAADSDVPVIGICFGGQLLARVHGGDSFRGTIPEVGWLPIRSRNTTLLPDGPWFQWHFDAFTLPPGAELIADSDAGPQAFVIDRSIGVQFHPEVTPEIMDNWVRVYRHELDEEGVDPDLLLEETRERASSSRSAALSLLDQYITDIAGLGHHSTDLKRDGSSAQSNERSTGETA